MINKNKMKKLSLCILIIFSCIAWMYGKTSYEDLKVYFNGFNGCFILYDESKNEYTIYNESKSKIQVSPCSTYKIIHSLIGLETKILKDENTTFKWDGKKYSSFPNWNHDQTLASAMKYSVVWYYQNLALKISKDKEQYYLNKINYGNNDLSGDLISFWIQSSLKISPMEQIEILKRFYHYQLPFSKRNVDIVKKIIILSRDNDVILSGKTGLGMVNSKMINGWFIGYVEKNKNVYFFATNIDAKDGATGIKAKEITLKLLKDKNILGD